MYFLLLFFGQKTLAGLNEYEFQPRKIRDYDVFHALVSVL